MSDSNPLKQLLRSLETQSAGSAERLTKSELQEDANLPAVPEGAEHNVPEGGYLTKAYAEGKQLGLRRENGAAKLKRLKPIHNRIIALHLSGWPNTEICKDVNRSPAWVSTVLNDPLAREVINNFEDLHEEEFKRLRVLANDSLRDAMQPTKTDSVRLQAARIFYQKDGQDSGEKGATAEDVMAQILQKIEAENVQINLNLGKS